MTLVLPPFLPPMLVTLAAGHFPEGDEDVLRHDLADAAWDYTKTQLNVLADLQAEQAQAVAASVVGEAGSAAAERMRAAEQNLRDLADFCASLTEHVKTAARDIEFEKLVVIFTLCILAVQLALAAAFPGGALVALARWITAKKTIQSVYLQLLARLVLNGADIVGSQPLLAILMRGGGSGAIQGGGADLVAQSLQIGADTRDIVDRQQLLVTTAAGFAGGVAGDVAARWMQPLTEAMGQLAGSAVGRKTQWMVELAVSAGVGGAAGAVAGTGTAVLMVGGDFGDIELAQTMYQGIGEGLIGAAGYALRPPATPLPGPVEQASVVPELSQALGNHRDSHPLISSEPGTEPMVSGGVSGSVPPLAVPEHSVPRSAPPVSHDVSIPIPVHTPLAMDIDTPADSPTATDSRSESRSAREYSEESAAAAADSLPAARQESTQQPARPAVVEGDPNIRGTAEQLRDGAADRPLDARGADTVATELDTWPAPLAEPIQATASETVIPQRDMPAVSPEPRASDSTADRPEMSRDVYESQPAAKGDQVAPQDGYATQESADGLVLPAGVGDASNPASRPTPAAVRPILGRTADSAARAGGTKESDHPPAQADTPTEATPTVFAPQDRTRQRPSSESASAAVRPPDRTEPPSAADRGPADATARDDLITSSPDDVKLSAAVGEFDPRGDDATASGADDPGDQANGEIGGRFDEFRIAPDIAPADKYAPLEDRAHLVAVQDALRGPDGRTRVHADPSKNRYGRLINDGGITKRGRSNNCVQLGIDAILSYYGRSAVSRPRIVRPRPVNGNEDVPLGEPWKRLEEWTGQLFRPPSDAVTVADQFDHLHAEVARMGPGSAALVRVRWETPAVDEEPAQRDGHILEVVYPEGAAKPVWWDAQSGETWDSPPSVWIEHSDDLCYIPITQEQGADLAAAASPDEARYEPNIGRGATVRWVPDTVPAENRRGSFALAAGPPTGASGQARGGDGDRQKPNSDNPENLSQPTDIGALPEPADYSPTYSGFGRWLRDAVGGLGMDEVQFAAAAGVNTEVVHRWLDGSGHPSPAVMQRLRDDSGLPADTLQAAVERFGLRDSSGTLYQLDTTFDAALDPRRFSETGAKLGNWLRATMDNRGKTATDLAQALGVSVPTVERWLRNESPPNLENQRRLREDLGIPGDIWATALEQFRIRGEGARPARSRRPPETGEHGPEKPVRGLDEHKAEGTTTETVAGIRDIDASNANTVRTMLGLWLTSWSPDPQYVREIADAVAATVAATAGSVELVVTSPGPAGESGVRDIAVIESFTGTVDSRSETVWRLSREPSVVERAVAEAGHSPLAWEIGHGRDAQAEDTEVDRQESWVRKQLRTEHPWMTADQINAAAAMFAETYARGLVDSPDPAGRVTIESTAEGPRGRGMRLTVETTLSEGRAVHLSPWYGDRPATESAGSGSPAAAGPHFLARADANGRSVELGTESRTVTQWFEIHHGSARQALTDVGPSSTSGPDRPPYRGLPESGGSGISRRHPNISDERETGGGAVGLPGTDPGAGNLGPPHDDGPPSSQPDSGAGETCDRGVAPGPPNASDDVADRRSGRGPGVGEWSPAVRTAQARTLRMSCRTRVPEGGVALVVDGRNRSEKTVDRPAYQARRFDIDGSPVVVADVFVHLTPNLTASAHEKNAVLGNVRVAVDKILNASPAARLPSGERLVIDVVDTEEPADGHLLVWYGQPGSGPDLWTSDDDARVIVDRVRRQLGLPITPAGDEPGFTGDDMHTLAEDLAAAAAGRNDSLSATRVIGPGGLGFLEKRGHQERVEEALREGDRYAVWADPMENPYGKLINAGGFGQPGRNTNCVDCVVAALDSFFGRPTVAYPRWIDRAVSLDTAVGEHRGAQRIAGAVGREWYVPEPDSGTVRDQLEELHRQVRRSGPGTAAIISNRWREDDGAPGASHVSLLVHPKGESGPVWWDPQSGELSRQVPEKLAEHSLSVKAITVPPGADPFSGRNTDASVSHSPEYVRDERVLSEKPDPAPVPPEPFSEEVPVVWEDDVAVVQLRPRPVDPVRVDDSEGHHSDSDQADAFPPNSGDGRPGTIVFDSAESVRAYAQEHWYDGTENHKLLNTYVTEGSAINHYLRGNPDWRNHTRRPWSEADVDSIVEQIRVMMKPLPDAVVVQRRVKPNRLSALREGDTVDESAFLSTTPDPHVPVYLEHMPGVLHLTVPAGTPVAFLRNGDDNEILLPPGIQWRVTDIVATDGNVRVHGVVGGAEEITKTPDPSGSSFPGPAEHSSFGDWLKSVRSHFGSSPKMFAVEVGVATRTVYNWESGRIPRHGHLLLIDRLERMPSGVLQDALDHFGVRDKTGNVVQLDS
ncbi:toxin glutamine deamidase domain-containing protein, partial [Nocardia carnea]|uniref:toxin glutamine deamidase domain-containing protein n=1 Tax=Nocardia carnea TaxID=37328 RepID=UPI002457495B